MKNLVVFFLLIFFSGSMVGQKYLLVEKIGTSRKYYYQKGNTLKLRVSKLDTLLRGRLWHIGDTSISVMELRSFEVSLNDIGSVYKQFSFPRKLGKTFAIGSAAIFSIIVINHLINNEAVFTPDLFIITGSVGAASLISFSLSQNRCKIGSKWKLKILDFQVN
ncbi:MAG: hypothetical protein PHF97_10230 [Bacteroidales bacterium]|nr:hypothetical protein [Bacteroidales bacterium]MDD4604170.1 hypothetical protein [Bacteroidales bacterium]